MKIDMKSRVKFIDAAKKQLGDKKTITRAEILEVVKKSKLPFPNWLTVSKKFRAGRATYHFSATAPTGFAKLKNVAAAKKPVAKFKRKKNQEPAKLPSVAPIVNSPEMTMTGPTNPSLPATQIMDLIPKKAEGYVPFGHYKDLKKVLASNIFYPTYITGLSGNGKTMMVEQIHADLGKELIRVNITIETDEDDLIGGFRLVDGATVWQNGPVIVAMERGATLLLDEVDLGSNKIMCLQPVLEGKGIYLKKINKFVAPQPGFTILATANTKGKGSDDGRFIGTNVMNEAFLERFSITLEQEYPAEKTEIEILNNLLETLGKPDESFTKILVTWAASIRETFKQGGITEIISTRRLVHICQAFAIFDNRKKSVEFCLSRFDTNTKQIMSEAYDKLDESIGNVDSDDAIVQSGSDIKVPF